MDKVMSNLNIKSTAFSTSPFPNLKPNVRYKTVMERAGFDVAYGKDVRSRQRSPEIDNRRGAGRHQPYMSNSRNAPSDSATTVTSLPLPGENRIVRPTISLTDTDRKTREPIGLGISASLPSLNPDERVTQTRVPSVITGRRDAAANDPSPLPKRSLHSSPNPDKESIFDFESGNAGTMPAATTGFLRPNPPPISNNQDTVGNANGAPYISLDPLEKSFFMITHPTPIKNEEQTVSGSESFLSKYDGVGYTPQASPSANFLQNPTSTHHSPVAAADKRKDYVAPVQSTVQENSDLLQPAAKLNDIDIKPDPLLERGLQFSESLEDFERENLPLGGAENTTNVDKLLAQLNDILLEPDNIEPDVGKYEQLQLPENPPFKLNKKSSAYLSHIPDAAVNIRQVLNVDYNENDHIRSPSGRLLSPVDQTPVMLTFKNRPTDDTWNEHDIYHDSLRNSRNGTNSVSSPSTENLTSSPTLQNSRSSSTLGGKVNPVSSISIPCASTGTLISQSYEATKRNPSIPISQQPLLSDSSQTPPLHLPNKPTKYPPGKGPCRSCNGEIKGKSIYSKRVGELSGQWHRECFRCTVCQVAFSRTVPCYILDDNTFCRHHFHEANNSICVVCNDYIEGECLENDNNETFHINCLSCYICKTLIQEDYYVYNNKFSLCTNHDMELLVRTGIDGIGSINNGHGDQIYNTLSKRKTRLINFGD
ncbi:HEL240Cp [Eremothecium sinecaudum]|uniref:HEL240Cp n=1 Tax=Eremothecium sinecaudum TaxID=45286 RepID=A0A0X8HSI2_9SACH|nr:HEL240Cp [Eremothecium sinecaudum]AMD21041.1 HEL240Cp [Eremothecium sinecaudum]